jgi:hypothetical protein
MNARLIRDVAIISAVALGVMGVYLYREWISTGGQYGVPLDDAWIHYQFASNLTQGNGFAYNLGEPVSGSTSPLWVFVLAGAFFLSGEFLVTSKVLSGFFFIGSAAAVYLFALQQGYQKHIALLSALFTIMAGRFGWSSLSGMEVTLFTFLSIAAVMKHCSDRREGRKSLSATVLFAVASLVRPEGYALFAFATIDTMLEVGYTRDRRCVITVRALPLVQVSLYLVIIAPYLIFSYYTTGHCLPQTYYAQNELFGLLKRLEYVKHYVASLWDDHPILFFFIPAGMVSYAQNALKRGAEKSHADSLLVLFWTVGYPLLAMLLAPNARHHHRYMMPLIPFYMVLATGGFVRFLSIAGDFCNRLELVSRLGKQTVSSRHGSIVLYALVLCVSVFLTVAVWSHRFAGDVENINSQQVAMGRWVKEHIPQEQVIALSDIGAITFIAERRRIIDMVGLVNPELLAAVRNSKKDYQDVLLDFLHQHKPDYVITHPTSYPRLVAEKEVLQEIYSIELKRYSGMSAGRTMAVYKTRWDNFKAVP